MRRKTTRIVLATALAAVVWSIASPASANKLDLSLARFVNCKTPFACEPQAAQYEAFLAEYAFGLAPKLLSPASTLGYSGFYLGLEGTLTPVPTGASAEERWDWGTAPYGEYPGAMFVPAVHVRKGLPWSFELGSSINYVAQSELVGLGGEIKWSIFEGYRHGFRGALPDVAARGSVVRVLGQSDIDLTIIGVDGSISYTFGAGGTLELTPYGGFQYLWSLVRIEPLIYRDYDGDDGELDGKGRFGPADTYYPADSTGAFDISGLSGPNLERMKLFLGFRLQFELLVITLEAGLGLKQEWETAVTQGAKGSAPDPDPTQYNTSVGTQFQMSGGVGMDF